MGTFAGDAGKVIKVNDADGAITLPTIKADSKGTKLALMTLM